MNLNTQICTNREQSIRLLALVLKKDTADYFIWEYKGKDYLAINSTESLMDEKLGDVYAWSLYRLIAMISNTKTLVDSDGNEWETSISIKNHIVKFVCFPVIVQTFDANDNLYDNLIDCIEWMIKSNHFNKDYLEEQP